MNQPVHQNRVGSLERDRASHEYDQDLARIREHALQFHVQREQVEHAVGG